MKKILFDDWNKSCPSYDELFDNEGQPLFKGHCLLVNKECRPKNCLIWYSLKGFQYDNAKKEK